MDNVSGILDIPDDVFNSYVIPGIELYLFEGIEPGGYLTALISGNLYMAACRADHQNSPRLADQAKWLLLNFPDNSFGTPENFKNWIKDKNKIRSTWAETMRTQHMWKILQGVA